MLYLPGSHYRNSCFRHAAAHVLSPPLRPDPSTPQAMCEALAELVYNIIHIHT